MPKRTDPAVLAWTRLVRAHTAAMRQVEAALKAADLPPLEWYDALLELEREGPLRPRNLQAKLLLAQYNLSRLLDRMAGAGLVERARCEGDGRGQMVSITGSGQALRRRMWPVYAEAIEKAVGAKLNTKDAATLAELLGRLTA